MDSLTPLHLAALPPEAPLAMPAQSLRRHPKATRKRPSSPKRIGWRRFWVVGSAIALTGIGVWQMQKVLAVNGLTPLAAVMLLLFTPLFAWIALSFTSGLAGFCCLLRRGPLALGIGRRGALPEPVGRTALLMPCYNENPTQVMAELQAMWESLRDADRADAFDIFILSDTTDPEVWIEEEAQFLALRARTVSEGLYYRRRKKNIARKSGNIADWVTRWGAAYPQFLILDADSVMQASTLLELVAAMEAHGDVGLIQTLPIITGGATFFARLQQFAGRIYGPLIANGIAWWHGAEGNYWGHNALIRTQAFADHAGLPELSGRKPFGGHILSHDFVEAALIRRAGWAVHMVPALVGSYEGGPPNLVELSVRDRRWCQGNLQHLGVLPARGLHWISRLHMLTGIGSYITAPLWLLFLLAGFLIALQSRFIMPGYFPEAGKTLFPVWTVIDPVRAMWMFAATMALLLVPKLLGCLATLWHGPDRRGCGGVVRLFLGLLLETLVSGLIAPVVMLSQSVNVMAILAGRDGGWQPQTRDDGVLPGSVVLRRYWRHTLLGVVMGGATWMVSTSLALWMSPVILGLGLAIPLVATTSRTVDFLLRLGILRIPEEASPPAVLARTSELAVDLSAIDQHQSLPERLLHHPNLLAAHIQMLPPARRPWQDPLDAALLTGRARIEEAPSLHAAWQAMTPAERAACLADQPALQAMQRHTS